MWIYEKKLEYPVKIKTPNPRYAKIIAAQLGGPHGETGAAMRYLSQRYSMPDRQVAGILTDVGTEELGHMEIISAIMHQLTRSMTPEEIVASGFDAYFINHTAGVYPADATGVPFDAKYFSSTGDVLADLNEDLAAEGTTVKEQPAFQTPEKALFHAGFGTFGILAQNRRLRPHKNNNSQKYDRTSCFQRKTPKHRQGF